MYTTYLICALVGGTLIVCQFVLTLFGLGGDHDLSDGGGTEFGADAGHHDATHGNESSWFFGMLTFRTLSAALAFFGLTGLAALQVDLEPVPALLISLGAGIGAMFLVGSVMRILIKLNADGTIRIDRSVGSRGTVYLSIPGQRGGVGKVQVSVFNRTLEYKAVTASSTLSTGAKIVVVGVVGPDTVEVAAVDAGN